MDKNTVYILQKDLPFAKAGAEFIRENEDADYYNTNFANYHDRIHKSRVINNIDWFKPKEEPQWEILSVFDDDKNPIYNPSKNIIDVTLKYNGERIHSVKRFPDNTVWSVDDDTQHGKISGFKIAGSTMIAEIKNTVFPYDYPLYLSELKAPKEEQVQPHKCKYCGIMVTSDSDEGCYANPNKPVDNIGSAGKTFTAPESLSQHPMCKTEEQVPIKVYALHYYGGEPNYHNHTLICSERIPVEKYDALKKLIQDFLNSPLGEIINYEQYKARKYTESELLQARRDAFDAARTVEPVSTLELENEKPLYKLMNTYPTFEDYINSLK